MNDGVIFLYNKFPLLMQKLLEQVYLTMGSVAIAMLISIPLGIYIARKNKLKKYILSFTNILQTLPSLAVMGFLLPFLGVGIKTAILALVIYAILPILQNTVTAFLGVAPDLLEAADGLGFTKSQKLWRVEFPLALPVIIAGVRTATAMSVGIATLAAFIGAGGLGDFIYEGLSLNSTRLILLGAIPAALLALVLDYIIGLFEKKITAKKHPVKKRKWALYYLTIIFFFFILAIGIGLFFTGSSKTNTVRVGTKNFTEQIILGEIITQLLRADTALHVVKKFNLGGTFICQRAIIRGDIDLYPEYTGTGYTVILSQTQPRSSAEIYNYVRQTYFDKFNLIWLNVFGFNNTNAVVVSRQVATKYSLRKISDLNAIAHRLVIGVPADFMERPDGFVGLKNKYHLEFGRVRLMDPGLMYKAIQLGQLDVIMGFSTDARILAYNLVVLEDDQHLFTAYFAAPIIRDDILKRHPNIKVVLDKLAGKINNNTMQNLNYQVDVLQKTPEEVASKFLKTLKES
ncbi:MAG: ABC transporter permease subunit [Gammaproteobacteria bacterium]|nr:ABC transporter permease subunit [Gammaproteobacteria bacterium]